jgi:FG-GAP repeat
MLFITDSAGVPSVAKIIKLQRANSNPRSADFNGDGFSDAAISDPYANPGGVADAGQVTVRYGNSTTIGGGTVDTLVQGAGAVGDSASAGDRFGFTQATADLDNDGYTDLLVGTPYEDVGTAADSGMAQIIWGSASGLGKAKASKDLTQTSFGRTVTAGDQLGYAVDAGNELGIDAPMLAVGVPGGNVSGQNDAGWAVFMFSGDGFSKPSTVDQDSPGIPGAAEPGDRYGESITLGLLAGTSNRVDAVLGSPGEDLGSGTTAITDGGSIHIVQDLFAGIVAGVALDQNTASVPGVPENGDFFGRAVDSGRAGSTTHLAVGVASEDIGTFADAGSVQLFSSSGATITPGEGLTQDTTGVAGTPEAGDQFGRRVALAPPGLGDTKTRMAVSMPYEDASAADSGRVQIFPLDDLGAEVTYDQNSTGIDGAAGAGDRFGEGLGFVAGAAERSFLVGVPFDVEFAGGMVNVIPLTGGSNRSWRPGAGGIPLTGADQFGAATAGEVP